MMGFEYLGPKEAGGRFLAAALVFVAGCAWAEGPQLGCYARDYSAGHLAKNPRQVVDQVTLWVSKDAQGEILADMDVVFAAQGHVGGSAFAGNSLSQGLVCFDSRGCAGCAVECDGGNFTVVKETASSMTIETKYLMVGDTEACGGAVDMAELFGQPVRYRLDKVDAAHCAGMGQLGAGDALPSDLGDRGLGQ